jgi:hypothetical protein
MMSHRAPGASPLVVAALLAVTSCMKQPHPGRSIDPAEIVFLTREGCANTALLKAHLDQALRLLHQPAPYRVIDLAALPSADLRTGYPTPTVLYRDRDVFGMPAPEAPNPEPT